MLRAGRKFCFVFLTCRGLISRMNNAFSGGSRRGDGRMSEGFLVERPIAGFIASFESLNQNVTPGSEGSIAHQSYVFLFQR